MSALSYIEAALRLAPIIIQAGEDLTPFAKAIFRVANSETLPTQADWDALHAKEQELRAVLQHPLPKRST